MARLIPHSSQAFEIFLVKWLIYEILTKINRVEPQLRSFFSAATLNYSSPQHYRQISMTAITTEICLCRISTYFAAHL